MTTNDWVTNTSYRHQRVSAGVTLCQEGDFGDTMYYVIAGSLHILKSVIQGAEKVIATLGVGQYVGEMSLLTGARRSATIRAAEETEVIEIDQQNFLQLVQDQPHICLDLLRQLAHRVHETTEELMLASLEAALAQREPPRMLAGSQRMRFLVTGSFAPEKTSAVMRLVAEHAPLAKSPALIASLIRPGRTKEALIYVLETDVPTDILDLIAPFMGLVEWDISPALEMDATLALTIGQAELHRLPL